MHGGPTTSPRGRQFITVMFIYINNTYKIYIYIYIYICTPFVRCRTAHGPFALMSVIMLICHLMYTCIHSAYNILRRGVTVMTNEINDFYGPTSCRSCTLIHRVPTTTGYTQSNILLIAFYIIIYSFEFWSRDTWQNYWIFSKLYDLQFFKSRILRISFTFAVYPIFANTLYVQNDVWTQRAPYSHVSSFYQ